MTDRMPTEAIYLTSKTRMVSEDRLRSDGRFFNLLISWYSFFLISVSILELVGLISGQVFGIFSVVFSIAIFGISIHINGERYAEQAESFHSCYLRLKEIFNLSTDDIEKMKLYNEALEQYPNHRDIDYDVMVVTAFSKGQKLRNAEGPINLTDSTSKRVSRYKARRFLYRFILCLFPFMIMAAAVVLNSEIADQKVPLERSVTDK